MTRSTSVVALVALAALALRPGAAPAQSLADLRPLRAPATAPPLTLPTTSFPWAPVAPRTAADRGIEDATPGVWVGAAVGAVVGALTASWAYCGLGEGDCGFSITAAGPGMLIGGIIGSSVGGILDQDPGEPQPEEGAYLEELRTYKEELATTDEELRRLTDQLIESDGFLEAMGSPSAAVIVVDRGLEVVAWNRRSEEMWGLPAETTGGVALEDLDIGLPVAEIRDDVLACARGEIDQAERDVSMDRRGETIDVRVRILPFVHEGRRHGAVILVEA